jgi:ribose transport system substrate-binding protein
LIFAKFGIAPPQVITCFNRSFSPMKKPLFASLAFLAAAVLASAADTYQIAVIPKGTTHEFWKSIHAGAEKAKVELAAQGIAERL